VAETPGSRGLYGFDARVAHPARVYDYWLGGKDNFEADRIAGEETIAAYPAIRASARANRAFLARTVSYLAADAGIRQFLDLGTGLPTASNTHEVAQSVAPESRVVYVDNDPLVLSHARALLTSSPEGVTAYLDADLRDTDQILEQAAATLDFGASSKSTLFVCTLEGRTLRLYRTGNGGTQWTVVAIAPDTVADGAVAPIRIVFPSDPAQGWWLPGYATAFSTTDAGRTWNPFMVG